MEYNWRYRSTLMRVFNGNTDTVTRSVVNGETTLNKHNACNRVFVIDVA